MKLKRRDKTQSLGEEIANATSHGIGVLMAIVGTVFMLLKANTTAAYVGVSIFGFALFMLYLMSCLYHAVPDDTTAKKVFKRFDHISIYLLIGGTFAPIFLIVLPEPLKWIMLACQWGVIFIGITLKAIWIYKLQWLHIILFLLLGWAGLFFIKDLYQLSSQAFWFILGGGLAYTLGVFFYATRLFKYSHFVWHLMVMVGSILQFVAIYVYLV